jgi:pimeloyl-ACP methyl ester carboxylesterase
VPRRLVLFMLVWLAAASLTGCANARPIPVRMQAPDQPAEGVVLVADGSGDLRQVTGNLTTVVRDSQAPVSVQRVQWSHGKGSVLKDLYDADRHKQQGKILAQQLLGQRQARPDQRICVVGYSSGASVALAAAEQLPPDTLDRIVLLAPTVASRHDLRPALRACREGIDSFQSEWDVICIVLFAMGTGDGVGSSIAGRVGFSPVIESPQDQVLYKRLRNHMWQGPSRWSGHDGGHFGCSHPAFLREQILPLLVGR